MKAYDDFIEQEIAKAMADIRPVVGQEEAARRIAATIRSDGEITTANWIGPDDGIATAIDILLNEASRDHSPEKIEAIGLVIMLLRNIDKRR